MTQMELPVLYGKPFPKLLDSYFLVGCGKLELTSNNSLGLRDISAFRITSDRKLLVCMHVTTIRHAIHSDLTGNLRCT